MVLQGEQQQNIPFASADGNPSSYERIHKTVSRAPAVWKQVYTVGGSQLEDVIYEKAEGEAIAKVSECFPANRYSLCPDSKQLEVGGFYHTPVEGSYSKRGSWG